MKTPMNFWTSSKIGIWLEQKEGYRIVSRKDTAEGHELILQDSFGFQYSIEIKTIRRVANAEKFNTTSNS